MVDKKENIENAKKYRQEVKKMTAAFFDLDGTLTKKNTGRGFFLFLILKRKIGIINTIKTGVIVLKHKTKMIDYYTAMNKIYEITKGASPKEVESLAVEYYSKKGKSMIRKDVLEILKEHQKNGFIVVLATNSWNMSAKEFAKDFGVKILVATEIEEKDGVFNGNVKKHCFGDFKKDVIISFAKKNNIDLEKSFAYSDSKKDIPMLSIVGNPVAVYPKKDMREIAKKKKYKIIG